MTQQRFTDRAMYDRIVTVVEKAIADAVSPHPYRSTVEGRDLLECTFETTTGRLAIASRYDHVNGLAYSLEARSLENPTDPYTLSRLDAVDFPGLVGAEPGTVRWRCPDDNISAEQFLSWWEGSVGTAAWESYAARFPCNEVSGPS